MESTASDWSRYEDGRYSIDFPSGWRLQQGEGGMVQIATADEDLCVTIQSFLSPDGDVQPATLSNLLEDFRDGRPLLSPALWLSSEVWNGLEAELSAGDQDHPRTRWIFRAVCLGARVVAVHINGDVDTIEELRETCERVLNSVRVADPPLA
jgi:hypothetical protein